ncbi:MAG: SPASM domain-containing protein [Bacteriovoracaceae bacterium]|nr:SPASM domain-containing protein [Bacteriovoracaceae bacterium]
MKFPEAVEIEINSACNMACSYCPNSVAKRVETGEMSEETYSLIMDQLQDLKFRGRISYDFYNEPLLCRNLEKFVSMAHEKLPKSKIIIYTNGTKLTLEKLEALIKCGVCEFVVTEHEDGQKGNDLFTKVYESLDESLKRYILFQKYSEIQLFNRGGVLEHLGPAEKLLPCQIPANIMTITVKGNVLPCFEDFYQDHEMGNVHNNHLREIWESDKYVTFRDELAKGLRHKYKACSGCNRTEVLF